MKKVIVLLLLSVSAHALHWHQRQPKKHSHSLLKRLKLDPQWNIGQYWELAAHPDKKKSEEYATMRVLEDYALVGGVGQPVNMEQVLRAHERAGNGMHGHSCYTFLGVHQVRMCGATATIDARDEQRQWLHSLVPDENGDIVVECPWKRTRQWLYPRKRTVLHNGQWIGPTAVFRFNLYI